ncbi:hypothetical protein VTJ49DRAFT_1099 [Mycothermus thermophilus]|uniref:diphosphoinositol-polyphosphate diphosphatase n=1 Tax=Humicola insolens TaxID=85995 RepID=A0ABR3VD66_HUMIN
MSQLEKSVMSKRSGRQFVEDGMEDDQQQDRQGIRTSTTSTTTSTPTSLEPSPLVRPADGQQHGNVDDNPLFLSTGDGRCRSQTELVHDVFHPPPTPQQLANSMIEAERGLPSTGRPANFGVVVPGVYRSSFPKAEDYEFIEELKLKTIVTLVRKDFPKGYDEFLQRNGIQHAVFDMKGTKKESIPIATMRAILSIVLDRRNHPLLIHCNHGKHRTGCVIGIVRKLSGWHINNIIREYRAFAEPKVRDCDIDYITAFELANISNLFRGDNAPSTTPISRMMSMVSMSTSSTDLVSLSSPFRTGPSSFGYSPFVSPGFLRATAFALILLATWLISGCMLARERGAEWTGAAEELLNEAAGVD